MSRLWARWFILTLSFLAVPLWGLVSTAHAEEFVVGSVPATQAVTSCEEKGAVNHLVQTIISSYCMGPTVEAKLLKTPGAKTVYDLTQSEVFDQALNSDRETKHALVSDKDIHRYMAKNSNYWTHILKPSLRFYYGEPSGLDNLTVGQHTVRVLNIYSQQKAKFNISQMPLPAGVRDLDTLIGYTLAFHDVGRSIAFKVGLFERLNTISIPFVHTLLSAPVDYDVHKKPIPFFYPPEVRIALGLLVEQQTLTKYMNHEISLAAAQESISSSARIMNFNPHVYFELLQLVNAADAASSKALGADLFTRDLSGKIIYRDQQLFQALAKSF